MRSVANCFRILFLVAIVAGAPAVRATTVVPPTFSELVAEAQTIARAKVTARECRWAFSPQGRVIKTYVTFTVLKTLKGEARETLTLEFLGGELDGEGMRVEGMPQFAPGDIEIVFVTGNTLRFCPLVAMGHGRYRVLTDPATARRYVARDDRAPLTSEREVQLPQGESATISSAEKMSAALSPEAFEEKISAEVSRVSTR